MRLGFLGGSFDPPHVGHLLAATDACEQLALDQLLFIPAAIQPLKAGQASASPEARLRMVELLAGDDPRFGVDPIEIRRSGLSYTVDTLAALAARHPAAERFFLVGADVEASFPRWREPDRILQLARLVVMVRDTAEEPGGAAPRGFPPGTTLLRTRRIDVSSTEIRQRIHAGQSIRGFVPEAVAAYIEAERLYR